MRTACFILASWALLAAASALGAPGADVEKAAAEQYRSAFEAGITARECVRSLEDLVRHYPESRWADDALWVLGEIADKAAYRKRAIQFRRQLLERKSPADLEPLTRTLAVYQQSRVPGVIKVLESTGSFYVTRDNKVLEFNPIPMLTHEDLAVDYEELGQTERAAQEYREALAAAPRECLLAGIYRQRLKRLEERLARETAAQGQKPAKADDASPGEQAPTANKGHSAQDQPKQSKAAPGEKESE